MKMCLICMNMGKTHFHWNSFAPESSHFETEAKGNLQASSSSRPAYLDGDQYLELPVLYLAFPFLRNRVTTELMLSREAEGLVIYL